MLTDTLRPRTWEQLVGQANTVTLLKAIIKNPDTAPRLLLFEGEVGCGKTSTARIFYREINNIPSDSKEDNWYYEFDVKDYGNVKSITQILDMMPYSSCGMWTVMVFDEFQRASEAVQSHLLKTLEELASKIFVIICTSEKEKIIEAMQSRALEVKFTPILPEVIDENLNTLAQQLNLKLSPESKTAIIYQSKFRMRDVHKLLDKYRIMGEEDFLSSYNSCMNLLSKFLVAVKNGNKKEADNILKLIQFNTLDNIKHDFEELMLQLTRAKAGITIHNTAVADAYNLIGDEFTKKLIHLYFSDLFSYCFRSTRDFVSAMWYIFDELPEG